MDVRELRCWTREAGRVLARRQIDAIYAAACGFGGGGDTYMEALEQVVKGEM